MLQILDHLPEGLLDTDPTELLNLLGGPTLIHLSGRRQPAVFVSVLLHGNETTGWDAMRRLLRQYQDAVLPRCLSLFIGNVRAAAESKRFLTGQPDYNRMWQATEDPENDNPERHMMQQLITEMRDRGVFASIDIHNNTGKNPHYACVNVTESRHLHLATLFSRTVVYFIRPTGVQSMAFGQFCPAVTLECGQAGVMAGTEHVLEYIDAVLHLSEFPSHEINHQDIDLYHTVATVKIPGNYDFGFDPVAHDIILDKNLEKLNFCELKPGTHFCNVREMLQIPLDVRDEDGNRVTEFHFSMNGEKVNTRRECVPAMLTLDTEVIRQDCLCYLMERYPLIR